MCALFASMEIHVQFLARVKGRITNTTSFLISVSTSVGSEGASPPSPLSLSLPPPATNVSAEPSRGNVETHRRVADVGRVRYDRHQTRFRASINLRVYDKVYRASLRMAARGERKGKRGRGVNRGRGISSCRLQGSGCGVETSGR